MTAPAGAFFDALADGYDETWTNTVTGRAQRDAVWRNLDPLVGRGQRVLEIGCGTGEDALHLARLGAEVVAIDASAAMARAARAKGVDARVLAAECVGDLDGGFDLIFSNFGALNCVTDLAALREPLARLLRPGGRMVLCLLNRFCLRESVHYFLRGRLQKAGRRWTGVAATARGLQIRYPSSRQLRSYLGPSFRLLSKIGIGIAVPPSFVAPPRPAAIKLLRRFDARIEQTGAAAAVADHGLYVFLRS